jgi:hypothetical protein
MLSLNIRMEESMEHKMNCRNCGNRATTISEPTESYLGQSGCKYCKEQIDFAKKHNLRVIVDNSTLDVVGVEYDKERYK